MVSGFWHGASWNFIFWGAFHGFFIVLERTAYGDLLMKIGKFPSIVLTFIIVNISWVFFRMPDMNEAFRFVQRMFTISYHPILKFDNEFKFYLALAIFFSFFAIVKQTKKIQADVYFNNYTNSRHLIMFVLCIILFVLSVGYITSTNFNPFIYFRF